MNIVLFGDYTLFDVIFFLTAVTCFLFGYGFQVACIDLKPKLLPIFDPYFKIGLDRWLAGQRTLVYSWSRTGIYICMVANSGSRFFQSQPWFKQLDFREMVDEETYISCKRSAQYVRVFVVAAVLVIAEKCFFKFFIAT